MKFIIIINYQSEAFLLSFPGGSDGKVSACNVGDPGSIPGLGRSPGGGNGNPLQYSCLENPMDGGAWQATVHGVAKSRTRLSDFTHKLSKGHSGKSDHFPNNKFKVLHLTFIFHTIRRKFRGEVTSWTMTSFKFSSLKLSFI